MTRINVLAVGADRLLNLLVMIPVSIITLIGDLAVMRIKDNDDDLFKSRVDLKKAHRSYPTGKAARVVVLPDGAVQIRRDLTIGDVVRKANCPATATYTVNLINSHFNGNHFDETYTLKRNYDGKQICDHLFHRAELVLVRRGRS